MGKKTGFAAMDPQRVKELGSKGGLAAHAGGAAHEFDSEEARRAGLKAGENRRARADAKADAEARRAHAKKKRNAA